MIVAGLVFIAIFAKVARDVYDPSLSTADRAARRERNVAGVI